MDLGGAGGHWEGNGGILGGTGGGKWRGLGDTGKEWGGMEESGRGLERALLGCTGCYWSLLGVTGPYWGLLVHTGPYWAVPAVPPARPELELPEGAELPWREGAELEVRCRVGGARPAANLRLTLGKGAGPRVGAANPRLGWVGGRGLSGAANLRL